MRNITVSVSDATYREARIWAAERDVSVSAVVAFLLETLPHIRRAESRFPAYIQESEGRNIQAAEACDIYAVESVHALTTEAENAQLRASQIRF
jgi:hypothetical protein